MRRRIGRASLCAGAIGVALGVSVPDGARVKGWPIQAWPIPGAHAQSSDSSSGTIENQVLPPPPNTAESKVLGSETNGPSIANPSVPPAPEAPQATTTPPVPASTVWVPGKQAQLTILDKIYGSARTISANIGTPFSVRFLTVTVLACWIRPPSLPPDAAVFLQVTDSHAPTGSPPEFRGWIFHAEPGLSGMSDAATDISVSGCS
jgi:hypothetical protein